MTAPPLGLPEAVWAWLCEGHTIRDDVVAAAQARLESGDWPDALLVADALLGLRPLQLV